MNTNLRRRILIDVDGFLLNQREIRHIWSVPEGRWPARWSVWSWSITTHRQLVRVTVSRTCFRRMGKQLVIKFHAERHVEKKLGKKRGSTRVCLECGHKASMAPACAGPRYILNPVSWGTRIAFKKISMFLGEKRKKPDAVMIIRSSLVANWKCKLGDWPSLVIVLIYACLVYMVVNSRYVIFYA